MQIINKLQQNNLGFSTLKAFLIVPALVVLAIITHLITHSGHQAINTNTGSNTQSSTSNSTTTTTKTTASNPYAVLSPATVPSKTAECSQQLVIDSTGNSGPVQCSNGDINVLEWNALSALEPVVMTLGYGATSAQVQSALCTDANASNSDANTKNSNVVEGSVYQISALYYGWNFSPSPSVVLTNGTC